MSLRAWLTRQVSSGKGVHEAPAEGQKKEGKKGRVEDDAASQPQHDQEQGDADLQAEQTAQGRVSLKDRLKTHVTKGPLSAGSASLKNRLKRHAKPSASKDAGNGAAAPNGGDAGDGSGREDSGAADNKERDEHEVQGDHAADAALGARNQTRTAEASSGPSFAEVQAAHPVAPQKASNEAADTKPRNGAEASARKAETKKGNVSKAKAKPKPKPRASHAGTKKTDARRAPAANTEPQPPLPSQEPVPPFLLFSAKHRRPLMNKEPKLTYLEATKRLREMYNAQPASVRQAAERKYQKQLRVWKKQQNKNGGGDEEDETDVLVREAKPRKRRVIRDSSSSGADDEEEEDDDDEDEDEGDDSQEEEEEDGESSGEEGASEEEEPPKKKAATGRRGTVKMGSREKQDRASATSKRGISSSAVKRRPGIASSKNGSDNSSSGSSSSSFMKPAKKPKTLDSFLKPRDPSQSPAFPPKQTVPMRKKKFLSKAEREQLAREKAAETQRMREERLRAKKEQKRAKEEEKRRQKEEREREKQKRREEKLKKQQEMKKRKKQKEQEQKQRQQHHTGPQEDETFKHNRHLPEGRTPPTRLQGNAFTQAMTVMEFVTNFHKGLPAADHVKSLSIEKLESVLFDAEDPTECNAILANMLIALLEIDDGPCATNVDIGCGIDLADLPLNKETASEVLHQYLQLMPSEYIPWDFDDVIEVLSQGDFSMLSAEQKVRVLAFLCNQHLDNDHVVEVLDDARESILEKRSKRFRLKRERAAAARKVKGTKGGKNPQMKQQIESDEALARRLSGLSNTRTSTVTDAEKELMKVEDELARVDTQLKDLQFTWGPRCVGRDRDFNHYYVFTCMHGLYRCTASSWSPLDEMSTGEDNEDGEEEDDDNDDDDDKREGKGKRGNGGAAQRPADEWRVYITKSELDSLLETLDTRGRREKELKAEVQRLLSQEYLTYLAATDIAEVDPSDEAKAAATSAPSNTTALDEKLKQQTQDDVRDTFTSLVEQGIDTVADVGDAISEAASYADLGACVLKMLQRIDDQWLQEPLGPAEKPSELHQEFATLCSECSSASQVQVVNHLLYNSIKWDTAATQRRSARLQRYPSHTPRTGRTTRRAAAVAKQRQREMYAAWETGDEDMDEEEEEEGGGDTEASDSEVHGSDAEEDEGEGQSNSSEEGEEEGEEEEEEHDGRSGGRGLRRSTRNAVRRSTRRRTFSPPREIQGVAVHTSHTASSSRGGRAVKEMQCCEAILKSLRKCEHAWPFLTPVTEKEDPDYVKSVENPMDFQTIMTQLDARQYADAGAFAADVQRVVDCSLEYYHEDTDEYAAALAIEKEFQRLWRDAFGDRRPLPESA